LTVLRALALDVVRVVRVEVVRGLRFRADALRRGARLRVTVLEALAFRVVRVVVRVVRVVVWPAANTAGTTPSTNASRGTANLFMFQIPPSR
jgi:hypothetical protein